MTSNYMLPRWADLVLLPLVSLTIALLAAAGVVAWVGQDPVEVIQVLIHGALGTERGISYTFYYATSGRYCRNKFFSRSNTSRNRMS